jgi:outer membrane biosynthesis protein TonB
MSDWENFTKLFTIHHKSVPSEQQNQKPIENPIEESNEEPIEESNEEPVEEPIEESNEEPVEEPIEESNEEPVEKPIEESNEESNEEHVEEPIEKPIEESNEESIHQQNGAKSYEESIYNWNLPTPSLTSISNGSDDGVPYNNNSRFIIGGIMFGTIMIVLGKYIKRIF